MMTVISPRELPELRQALYMHPAMPELLYRQWSVWADHLRQSGGDIDAADSYVGSTGNALRTAELHYIDQRFCALVSAAASSLPATALAEHDLPTPRGLTYFSEPLLDGKTGGLARWVALWSLVDDIDRNQPNTGFIVHWFVDRDSKWRRSGMAAAVDEEGLDQDSRDVAMRALPPFCPSLVGAVNFGSNDREALQDPEPGSVFWLLRYLLATWHVQRQRLTTSRIVRPNRAALRRLARAGDATDPAVRVISLRTPDRNGEAVRESHEYQHQWIVRGHWRQQWYPSIADHRPVWIAPHIKGPDDAPLLGGEKVYAWQR